MAEQLGQELGVPAYRVRWVVTTMLPHHGVVLALRQEIPRAYLALREDPGRSPEQWAVLDQLVRERGPRKALRREPAKAEGTQEEDDQTP